jgi:argininosuccinate lyase
MKNIQKTTVGEIGEETLAYTAGRDVQLDLDLVEADCIGSAAHVTMLSRMPLRPGLLTPSDARNVIRELVAIMRRAKAKRFRITLADQDVHMAVERVLTEKLGDLGKKIHTGRSRNDQVALDLRLYGKEQVLGAIGEAAVLADGLLAFSRKYKMVPMVGRTHMQPAMPSTVGLWASSFAEALLDDIALLIGAYEMNDRSPLGSAAGYGVPLPVDRQLVSDLLGFRAPCHNVLYAGGTRGKLESVILGAMAQTMLTLSRLAQDLILFTMPEFSYFTMPAEFCTGSSIMPQKKNPDVLELLRAKTAGVHACNVAVYDLCKALPSGYNRDLQEAKGFFMEGVSSTRSSLRIAAQLIAGTRANEAALLSGFSPAVFATDWALELVGQGQPFRDAYDQVKRHLDDLQQMDPHKAVAKKRHLGGTGGLDLAMLEKRVRKARRFAAAEVAAYRAAVSKLIGVRYPL